MSITVISACWANPTQSRAVVMTAERGAVLVRPDKPAEWQQFQEWIRGGNTPAPYVAPQTNYMDARVNAVLVEIGDEPGDALRAIIHAIFVLTGELAARGSAQTAAFTNLATKLNAIRLRYPAP